ncbi:MAG: hypothetical protein KJ593_02770 [Candidatus Omnitrophica bacterium]|nr:hypothetical protein [Candidatus Omnitrophota bacterium]
MKNYVFKSLLVSILVLGFFLSHGPLFTKLAFCKDAPTRDMPELPKVSPEPTSQPPHLNKPIDPNFDAAYLLDWTDADCAEAYKLEEADNPQFSNPVSYSSSASQFFVDKGTTGTYYYRVKAVLPASKGITKGENFLQKIFSWLKQYFSANQAYAGTTCDTIATTGWSNTETIDIVEPISFIDAIVYTADTEIPLQDAVVTSPDFPGSATSDIDGKFSFSFQTLFPESGKLTVTIDITKGDFTSAQRTVEVVASRHSAVASIYLTPLDPVVTTIPPEGGTHINSTGEIELIFPEGAVEEPTDINTTQYQKGKTLPDELPETSFFTYALNLETETTITRRKVTTFQQPVTMRVANTLGFAPGTPVPGGVYNEETHQWEDTGLMGYVSTDGAWLEFEITSFSSWDLNLPVRRRTRTRRTVVRKNAVKETVKKDEEAEDPGVSVRSGALNIEHTLPAIKRLGKESSLVFNYNSNTASPSEFISIETNLDTGTTDIPYTSTFSVDFAGKIAQATYQGVEGDVRYAYLFDGKTPAGEYLSTGSYPYTIKISNDYADLTYWTTDSFAGDPIADTGIPAIEPVPITSDIDRRLIINNQRNSPFGTGWTLKGLDRLYHDPDGDMLLMKGDGSSAVFMNAAFIYVTNELWDVSVINAKTNSLIDEVLLNEASYDIAITPDGTRAYLIAAEATSAYLSVIDTSINEVIDKILIDIPGDPWGSISITPDGKYAYVSGFSPGIIIFDIQKGSPTYHTVVDTITTPDYVLDMKFNSNGTFCYATCPDSDLFIVIDTNTKQVVDELELPMFSGPFGLALSPSEKSAYVVENYAGTVDVIDIDPLNPSYLTVLDTVTIGGEPGDIAIQKNGYFGYVTNMISRTISVIDIRTNEIVKTIDEGGMASFILALSQDDDSLYVLEGPIITMSTEGPLTTNSNEDSNQVAIINTSSNEIVERIPLSGAIQGIAITPTNIFRSPEGDYSVLRENNDNTFTRRLKDDTKVNFNAHGLQASIVDRNGNSTAYLYIDANSDGITEELSRITLPKGGKYQLSYTPQGKLESITDPAARITQFTIDENNDLIEIINPDTTTKSFIYTDHLLTSETNERSYTTSYEYDDYGRVERMLFPNTPQETIQFFPSDVQGLINDLPAGVGTPDNPAPVVRPQDIVETIIDGKDYSIVSQTSKFGAYSQITDALDQTTTIERDGNNNPTKITRPNTSTVTMSYDGRGNLLTSTEDSISATTAFTYEPDFNQITSITDPENNTTNIDYDENGNPIQIADAQANITKMEYDSRGLVTKIISGFATAVENQTTFTYYTDTYNLKTITDPIGKTTTFTYDNAGNILTIQDAENNTTAFEYDDMNRLTKVTDPETNITQYQYDAAGNLKKIIDANLKETTFTYDEINQLKTITNALGKTKAFSYDLNRNLETTTDFNADTITFAYDDINRLTNKSGTGLNVTYDYDSVNNLTSLTTPDSSLSLTYDLASRIEASTTLDLGHQPGTIISYAYDKNSNRLTLTDPESIVTKYVYDSLNRLIDITDALDQNLAHFNYDELSRRTGLDLANGTSSSYAYDLASRLVSLDSYSYTYDNAGNRLTMTDNDGTHNYTYDDIYRLTNAAHPQPENPAENYAYDSVGNRNPASYTYNDANRLLEDDEYTYTYDDNGNLISKTNKSTLETTSYIYNLGNQLISIDFPNSTSVQYTYDGLGRRIEKNVNGTITRYIYDNEDIIAEYDGTNTLQAKYLHGPGIDEPLNIERGGQTYWYHVDGLGSITALTDDTGTVVQTYLYDSFGNIKAETGSLINPYTYTGRELDPESGLYYYRARYYDASIGRFLQEDQLFGLAKLPQTFNGYLYSLNNPLIFIDPFGLQRR